MCVKVFGIRCVNDSNVRNNAIDFKFTWASVNRLEQLYAYTYVVFNIVRLLYDEDPYIRNTTVVACSIKHKSRCR